MSKMTINHAISILILNRPFGGDIESDELQKAIDMSIESLKLQIGMKKHCDSHNCNDCRTKGMCAKTFFLDELQ